VCRSEPELPRSFPGPLVILLAAATFALLIALPSAARAEDYRCQGSTAPSGHCYAQAQVIPSSNDGSSVHIFTNNDYVPPLCNGDTTLCDFVTNESWVGFNNSEPLYWTEAGDFTGGDFGYDTETPTDFAGNNPTNGAGFGFFVWPSGGPGQDSANLVQILYNGGGNYSINFDERNVFNFGNDGAPYDLEAGLEETDTRIKSEGAIYDMYYYPDGKSKWWPEGTSRYMTPENSSILCGDLFKAEGHTTELTFETTSTFGGSTCA
jgi:hypothetical protein